MKRIPALMWLVSGMPALTDIPVGRLYLSALIAIAGLSLSVWSIVYMKRVGKGNPFDAMGHEVAPRTRHLMTDGPYKRSRNPMLSGTYLYYAGIVVALWNWWALLVFAAVRLMAYADRFEIDGLTFAWWCQESPEGEALPQIDGADGPFRLPAYRRVTFSVNF